MGSRSGRILAVSLCTALGVLVGTAFGGLVGFVAAVVGSSNREFPRRMPIAAAALMVGAWAGTVVVQGHINVLYAVRRPVASQLALAAFIVTMVSVVLQGLAVRRDGPQSG